MRVVTFNILHGRTVGGGVDPLLLRDAIRRLGPDILALQEVDVDQERSGRTDLTAVAAEAMDAVAHRFVAAIAGTPGSTWAAATGAERPGAAAYGIALLSRYPASDWRVLRLPPVPRRVLIASDEPRAAVMAGFDTPLGPLTVATTHLTFVPGWNRRQLRRVVAAVNERPGPRLVVGDLNLRASVARRESGMHTLAVAPTYPAHRPRRQLDHVLTNDPGLSARHWEAPAMPISDHRPLVVDLRRR
ncbi:endonuclease/exonuclease/phosphatase family protein [Mycolicibacterium madagascariense]|uniref:endonuclease/exonuclease/phosphatase family protein n=1 Tax=Mycolicibacterium madagascariense TaxID=212765 RepID=UPI0013D59063|nr:endonuclease/exonuclease/phosphatase family protein [Mycolicibacterium madagascariense]MCV7015178.1 endonuclease/exonuclease/phosphatase family protein [Mycolicibacterium madagascariense]